ncbi:MAG TPA: farnesyl diphosphate synthase [Paenalcaligenes sp.]|nr:farnesyl diphosphate synthase [Paenalcaligenes sp.]
MTTDTMRAAQVLEHRAAQVEQVLEGLMPSEETVPQRLHDAMRYAVLGGGKRIRAALVYAAGEAATGGKSLNAAQQKAIDHCAAAVEMIHAYSLVHDDMPCMDDDVLRRGQPTVHVAYDEATAMLVGDALQPLAFEALATMPIAPALIVQAMAELSRAIGSQGMVGGQAIDCDHVGQQLSIEELRTMHEMKTGALLKASVLLGGIVAGASSKVRNHLRDYADAVGLAFQVADDILDVTADTDTLGKTAGKDQAQNKPTYVSLMGLEAAQELLQQLVQQAQSALLPIGEGRQTLGVLAHFIAARDH